MTLGDYVVVTWHESCSAPNHNLLQELINSLWITFIKKVIDKPLFVCYIILMMSDPYSQMTDEDHDDMRAWLDNLDAEPVYDDPGLRCGCEDAPCCGC